MNFSLSVLILKISLRCLSVKNLMIIVHLFYLSSLYGQKVKLVTDAFQSLKPEPEIIRLENNLDIPADNGHFQGIQFVELDRADKLLISGSSDTLSYLIQADLLSKKVEKIIPLMPDPYRHAGGIQVCQTSLIVGIEDNYTRNRSKVCIYDFSQTIWDPFSPILSIDRGGPPTLYTAGATGLLAGKAGYLAVVANWDSRNWDFYQLDLVEKERVFLYRFDAPDSWASYQSINLLQDEQDIYAIAFYQKENEHRADLILISGLNNFSPIMQKINSKTFNCQQGADFNSAAGLQVDQDGKLHIWSAQKFTGKQIVVNHFSNGH